FRQTSHFPKNFCEVFLLRSFCSVTLDDLGQSGNCWGFEDGAQWDRNIECRPKPRNDLRGEQRMAAQLSSRPTSLRCSTVHQTSATFCCTASRWFIAVCSGAFCGIISASTCRSALPFALRANESTRT